MLSIKKLSRKFGRQSLSEVKPAPPSSTVDHTAPFTEGTFTTPAFALTSSPLFTKSTDSQCDCAPLSHDLAPSCDHTPLSHDLTPSYSSDSEAEDGPTSATQASRVIHKKSLSSAKVRMERVSSAEKRTYRQYKYSTGSSSSGNSSDDEIREAFEGHTRYSSLTSMKSSLKDFQQESPHSWAADPLSVKRPLKVLPLGHRKPKYFAQMSSAYAERPRLNFDKMQHSKRLVMVRRPLVLRNNSKVHSLTRPSPSLEVSLDISAHCFQPVLTQT